jgi:hypothetical protein
MCSDIETFQDVCYPVGGRLAGRYVEEKEQDTSVG